MLIICGFCGTSLTNDARCSCRPIARRRRAEARSHLHDVVRTAAELGGVTETTLAQAARALEERAS